MVVPKLGWERDGGLCMGDVLRIVECNMPMLVMSGHCDGLCLKDGKQWLGVEPLEMRT